MFAAHATQLIATLWVGSLWAIGYLVAPTLFATLADRALAGTIAGSLFRIEAWLSVACAVLLVLLFRAGADKARNTKHLTWLALAMLVCTVIGYFALHPFMAELRTAAGPGGVMDDAARARFGMLHMASSAFYLVQSALGVLLILRLR